MIKTLSKAQKMEREKFRIPRSAQDAIPIRRIFADGIFQVGNRYSKTWSFTDINYAIASKEDKTSMFLDYSELLNALDSGASAKITIYNRRINKAEFERSVLLPNKDDGLDEYRHEFNQMLTAQVTGTSNSIVRERYLTVSVVKRNADEARSYFARVGTDLVTHLAQLSSVAQELTLTERLHIFRDFFQGRGTGCGGVQYPRTRQTRAAFQGLVLPRQHGVCRRPFQAGRTIWQGAVFAGLCQLHQGQLCVGTLRP